ncbi:MAG TPA: hypothetical protein VFQ80_05380 [Thermomicrobiales bacterium]|jgi:hypothetical protein|nr:hypothetical protein [Thermomicrobiales bacterium]
MTAPDSTLSDPMAGEIAFDRDGATRPPPAVAAGSADPPFEIVEPHQAGAYGFVVRVRATGRLCRITPARDPREPRFWCVVVYRCNASGLPDGAERPWIGSAGMRREDLREALGAIRADIDGWLTATACAEFRTWFLAPADTPPRAHANGKTNG